MTCDVIDGHVTCDVIDSHVTCDVIDSHVTCDVIDSHVTCDVIVEFGKSSPVSVHFSGLPSALESWQQLANPAINKCVLVFNERTVPPPPPPNDLLKPSLNK